MIVTELEKFANQTVSCVSEGIYIGDFDVDENGEIQDFPDGIVNAIFGFRYIGVVISNDITFSSEQEEHQISKKKVDKVMIRMENATEGRVGGSYESLNPFEYDKFRNTADVYFFDNLAIEQDVVEAQIDSTADNRDPRSEFKASDKELFSGDYIAEFPQVTDEEVRWAILQEYPAPMTILGLYMRGTVRLG